MQIIIKKWEHVNRSFSNWDTPNGVHVKSKDHYDRLMKESGAISYEKAQELVKNKKMKEYKISDESLEIIKSAKSHADKNGNVKLSDSAIKALIDRKAIGRKIPSYMKLPSKYTGQGGLI